MLTSEYVNTPQAGHLPPSARIDPALSDAFFRARNAAEFLNGWLSLQCQIISGTTAGLLLLDDGDGHFSTAAAWPDPRRDLAYLTDTAEQTLARRQSIVQPGAETSSSKAAYIGQPVDVDGGLKGVVVIDLQKPPGDVPTADPHHQPWK